MNIIEKRIAVLREHAPILAGLCLAMHDRPEVAQLDDWVYNCSGSYATLGALLSEMFPAYEGLTISVKTDTHNGKSAFFDGHNAFEEFVISVFDVIAEYHNGFDGHVYDMDKITAGFLQYILSEETIND